LPKVSILLPTRDGYSYLKACVQSILENTRYGNYELIIINNRSQEPATLEYLDQLSEHNSAKVIPYDKPYNFSAINNYAVQVATGEAVCLLNNDTEVITPGWLEEMVSRLVQPGVGIVGAKLYYSDGRVQHAGDTLGPEGEAHHLHSRIGRDDGGYCDRAKLAQDLTCVTGACLLTWKRLFLEVGGLDEINLPVAFNDVDYCLKVREKGYRVLWTPFAELYHHESVTRGRDDNPEKYQFTRRQSRYIRKRWKKKHPYDPFYNPNLKTCPPDFSLSFDPPVKKPWRR